MLALSARVSVLTGLLSLALAAPARAQTAIPFVVNDLYVMPNSILGNYQPGPLTSFNGYGYFAATSAVNGRELYRTDGTPGGTTLVRDINPGTGDSSPDNFVVWNGALYFTANDGTHGAELWRTDGTAAGTRMVADLSPGNPSSSISFLAPTPNGLAFESGTGVCRVTDGTTVTTIVPKGACCIPSGACVLTDNTGCSSQSGMWGGLGVPCATVTCNQQVSISCCKPDKSCVYLLAAACTAQGGTPNAVNIACGGCADPALFACCSTATGACSVGPLSACVTTGTFLYLTQACNPDPCPLSPFACCLPSGQCFMVRISDDCSSRSGVPRAAGGTCVSSSYDTGCTQPTFACCRTTGLCTVSTPNSCRSSGGFVRPLGTTCAAAACFVPNTSNLSPGGGTPFKLGNQALVLSAGQIWITDGTLAGSSKLGSGPSSLAFDGNLPRLVGNRLYFYSGGDFSLWSSDGTAAGTGVVSAVPAGSIYGANGSVCASGGFLYYPGRDAANVVQLARTDSTPEGTTFLTNYTNPAGQPLDLSPINGGVLFNAYDTAGTRRWYVADGTPGGVQPVTFSGSPLVPPVSPGHIDFDGGALFAARVGSDDVGLWSTDGTPAGARLVYPSINPTRFSWHAGRAYFMASDLHDPAHTEADILWVTDGTTAGTSIVAHINGSQQPSLSSFTPGSGDDLFFVADSATYGNELFKTSGSPASTAVVKDILSGPAGSYPTNLVYAGQTLLFNARTPTSGSTSYVYRSDGTAAGTYPLGLTDAYCCSGTRATNLIALGNQILYFDGTPSSGLELFRSNGTPSGTALVSEAIPGPADGVWGSPASVVFNGSVFYSAKNGLYRSDGTAAGTVLVRPTPDGYAGANFLLSTPIGVFFSPGTGGLWFTDGSAVNTRQINDGGPGFDPTGSFVSSGGLLYFAGAAPASGWELWSTDGTVAGTHLVADVTPGNPYGANGPKPTNLVALGSSVFFSFRYTGNGPLAWYETDGTAAGTHAAFTPDAFPHTVDAIFRAPDRLLVVTADTNPTRYDLWSYTGSVATMVNLTASDNTSAVSSPFQTSVAAGQYTYLTRVYSSYYFQALYRTDGTVAGTVQLTSAPFPLVNNSVSNIVAFGDDVCFAGTGTSSALGGQIYRTHAPANDLQLVADLSPFSTGTDLTVAGGGGGGSLYFVGISPLWGRQVWVSDGSPAGTHVVAPINTDFPSLSPQSIRTAGGLFYLQESGGQVLYRTDGTLAGSAPIARFSSGWSLASTADLGGLLYFRGYDPAAGSELWRTDGTVSGTALVSDLIPGGDVSGPYGSAPDTFATIGNRVFFRGGNFPEGSSHSGREPCISDGTPAGTSLVKRLSTTISGGSNPSLFTDLNGLAIFIATNTSVNGAAVGTELFRSDGTAAGTSIIKDILPGSGSSLPRDLTAAGEYVFFSADDGVHGRELWRTDGTPAGTVMVKDICIGDLSSGPANFVAAGNRIFFTAYTPETGIELWTSDGTGPGTFMLFEIIPGPSSADIKSVTRAGNRIYFQATVPPQRPSLWSFNWFGSLTAHFLCAADYNRSGDPSVQDIFDFLNDWFAGASRADINGNGQLEVQDIFDFINVWLAGC